MNCIHLEKEPIQDQVDIIKPDTEAVVATLCAKQCFPIFQADPRNNPRESEAYNVYMSIDPDLPKEQWILLNDKPIPRTPDDKFHYKIPGTIPGATYYIYIITLNALGFESYPSGVLTLDGGDGTVDLE
jgi:hypothetical protein